MTMPRVLPTLVLIAVLGMPAALLPPAPAAAARRIKTETMPISIACTPIAPGEWDQDCFPAFFFSVKTTGVLKLKFRASPDHCSSIRVRLFGRGELGMFVDELFASEPLAPGAATPVVDLGALGRGSGDYLLEAEGIAGGCNTGYLLGWGGKLKVTTSKRARR